MFKKLDFGPKVKKLYADFNIDESMLIDNQTSLLKEDLLQVIYDDDYLIDVGWYPEFNIKGDFNVKVIKEFDWDNPLFEKKCKDIGVLYEYIQQSIEIVKKSRND